MADLFFKSRSATFCLTAQKELRKKDIYVQSAQEMAERVFENKNDAQTWLSTPNLALGGNTPLKHCQTELGLQQVRRILASIEYGGVV